MSHHFDYSADERLDISDAYCFAGPSDAFGPRTVFGMNACPNNAGPWDPAGYYELKVDTNEDLVEDITWRFTFPVDGTNALWDPWQGSHNGKGLTEDAFDNAAKVIPNQDFVSGLTQPAKLLDYFPYLAPPES